MFWNISANSVKYSKEEYAKMFLQPKVYRIQFLSNVLEYICKQCKILKICQFGGGIRQFKEIHQIYIYIKLYVWVGYCVPVGGVGRILCTCRWSGSDTVYL